MQWLSQSPAETRRAARALAERIGPGGMTLALSGTLGAGKTVFAKGVAEGLGVAPGLVSSPTFVIAHELPTPDGRRLVHADWYRLERASELEAAGLRDWLAHGVVLVVEWADRFPGELPADRLEVRLEPAEAPEARRIAVRAHGPSAEAVLRGWEPGPRP